MMILQAARADVALERFLGDRLERVVGELQLDVLEPMMVWYCRTSEFFGSRRISISALLVELVERGHHRQAADELGDQAELDQVLGMHLLQELAGLLLFLRGDLRAEAHRLLRSAGAR